MQQNHETERNEQHVCAAPGCTALCTGEYCRRHKPRHPMAVYLGRATGLKQEIRETRELLAQLREQATRATSRLSATRLSGTGRHDAMAGKAIRIVEAEERLEKIIADWAEALAVRVALLGMMEDPRERRLLELRPMLTQMNQLAELTADAAQQIAKAPWKPYIALADTAVLTEEGTADA